MDDAVGGGLQRGQGGEVDIDDGEGGGVAARVAETLHVDGGLVHAGDVDQKCVRVSLSGGLLRFPISDHELTTGFIEHAGLCVDLTAEVLRDDDGMIGTEAGDLAFEELAVGFVDLGDLVTVDDEDAALAVLGLFEAQRAAPRERGENRRSRRCRR